MFAIKSLKLGKIAYFPPGIFPVPCRKYVSACLEQFAVVYNQHGDPSKVLEGKVTQLPRSVGPHDVFFRMMAAPINPADINMVQGVYPLKPSLPAVGGNEGVGRVESIGSNVTSVNIGDWVLPARAGAGTWKSMDTCHENELLVVPNDISIESAATLAVNPCTAYRLLKDFKDLKAGDVVMQNGANSGVGQAVIQIAASLNIQTINIVRNRPDLDELVDVLKGLGATYVITDEFIRKPEMKKFMQSIARPKLALNCVGGKISADLLKYIDNRGIMVTYGGMSKQPLMVPAGPLIFKDIQLRGYWMTQWNIDHHGSPERQKMLNDLCDMIKQNLLKHPPVRHIPIANFKEAISNAMTPLTTEKQLLCMSDI